MEKNYDAAIKQARELASRGLFAQGVLLVGTLPLGNDRMTELIEELEGLAKQRRLDEHNALYRPALIGVCRAIKSGEVGRTATAFKPYRDSIRFGCGPRLDADLERVVQLMFEFIFEPVLIMGIRAAETGDEQRAAEHFDLAEKAAAIMGIRIPNMLEKTREHLDARRAH